MAEPATDADFVIVGCGVSGLTLAHYLVDRLPADTSIAIVDRDDDPDYNISFWTEHETPFEPVMQHTWRRIAVRYGDRTTESPLRRYRLQAFWRDDFDAFVLEELRSAPNVTFVGAAVTAIDDLQDHVDVHTTTGSLRARWAFDSRALPSVRRDQRDATWLMQGLAVEVACDTPVFDPDTATLFDFIVDSPQFDFMYVLPYTDRTALVNIAYVTPFETAITRETCEEVIADYVAHRLGCPDHAVTRACYGRIALRTDHDDRRRYERVVPIGRRGGLMKASTSYAFSRILEDSACIASALRDTGEPYYDDARPGYYRRMDASTAGVFQRDPEVAQQLMYSMFTPANGDLALAFLDEKNSLQDNRRIMSHVPVSVLRRFLWSLVRSSVS